MKMKKIGLVSSIALCSAFAFLLTSCEGSKKITYIDDEGNEQTVTLKKTSDEEQIAEDITALVYSKGSSKFKPNGVSIAASAEVKMSGVQVSNDKKFSFGGSTSEKVMFTFGDYEKTEKIDNYAAYAEASISAKIPTTFIENLGEESSPIALDALSETDVDYSQTSKVAATAKIYGDKDAYYFNLSKLDLPWDKNEKLNTFKPIVENNLVGKYVKLDAEAGASILPAKYSGILFGMDELAKMYYTSYTEDTTFVDTIYSGMQDELKPSEFKENVKKLLETTNLVISSVDGSKITFKYSMAKKDAKDDEYKGKSNVSVTFDIVKKVPTAVSCDMGDYLAFMVNENEADSKPVKDVKVTAKASVSIKFNPSVPKISKKNAENATDLSGLMNLFK